MSQHGIRAAFQEHGMVSNPYSMDDKHVQLQRIRKPAPSIDVLSEYHFVMLLTPKRTETIS